MISQPRNRVQAIKSKFENLNSDSAPLLKRKTSKDCDQLCKQAFITHDYNKIQCDNDSVTSETQDKENSCSLEQFNSQRDQLLSDTCPKPNPSYLYNKGDIKRTASDTKKSLSRQSSDPGKKLHRSHAFRCDRSQKMPDSPKRHGSCHGRSESGDFTLKPSDKKLSKDRLKRLGNVLEDRMKKEHFVCNTIMNPPSDSIPDSEVPKHILDQYAKVIKPKKEENKQDGLTDSGVSSETENNDDEKVGKIRKLMSQFEKPESSQNLEVIKDLSISTETMKLERKNPHLKLTDTLKKALKQPLPIGPPPKKPPRSFVIPPSIEESPAKQKKDTKKMLEKLEQVLQQREAQKQSKNIYDIAENVPEEKPKEVHYLCTEILDIAHKTLLPNQNLSDSITKCFNSLNCTIPTNSMSSLPYTRMSIHSNSNRNSVRICCSCSTDSIDRRPNRLSTFLGEEPCSKCQANHDRHDKFKCHLNCHCKDGKSKFFVEKEHIYDVPFASNETMRSFKRNNKYGTLNSCKNVSKSLEDLRAHGNTEEKIYDIPCEASRSPSPECVTSSPKSDFETLRRNFEHGCQGSGFKSDKPMVTPKPILMNNRCSKSTENIPEIKMAATERRFATEKKFKKRDSRLSLPKKDNSQLEVDKENLNRLMSEIYETVTAACTMEDNKPGSFPTDTTSSEESIKLTRSLTEKRKNYVRRVSSKVAYLDNKNTRYRHQTSVCSYKSEILDNPYSTFRSWKSFRASQCNLTLTDKTSTSPVKTEMADLRQLSDSKCNLTDSKGNLLSMRDELDTVSVDSLDEKAGCVDISLPFEPRERGLFNVCLLVGFNYLTGEAYVKSVFPSQVQVPPHIESLIFPETLASSKDNGNTDTVSQNYSLVLTDERGERSYGYCRRVLPEGASTCLPLCYCLIGKYRAPGFYYKVLQEIESHHGSSDEVITSTLQQLFDSDFPSPGEEITIYSEIATNTRTNYKNNSEKSQTLPDMRTNGSVSVKSDKDSVSVKSSEMCRSGSGGILKELCDIDNINGYKNVLVNISSPGIRTIKRPLEPRIDEDCYSILLDTLGAGLVIKVFATLLLERKVIIICDQLSLASWCVSGLQALLYPLSWQHALVASLPPALRRAARAAPLPLLAATLPADDDHASDDQNFDEGMLLDLNHPTKVLVYQGDEATILPASAYKSLKTALQMESKSRDTPDNRTRNVMISEAFLRFFVDIFGDLTKFYNQADDGKTFVFDKESFIKNASSKQNQYFLEWFTETAMFNHFIQNMLTIHSNRLNNTFTPLLDTPLPDYYEMFEERIKSRNKNKGLEKSNYKNAVNKRVKMLKNKLRDLIA